MAELRTRTQTDNQHFREVLGQYPTGVSVVTAIQADGTPTGLAVGSFTSISLNPPLVAFMADRSSTSWPKIEATGSFCANVLASDQEHICRVFASKAPDKFTDLGWTPAGSGSPILDGAVAWVDCDIHTVHEAGDHFIVIGEVRNLQVKRPALPLLFFRGGYGSFAPSSSTAVEEDLLGHLRMVDKIRPAMEGIAEDLGLECNAAVILGEEFVHIAKAGRSSQEEAPTRVGRRLPFRPPVGTAFAAWGTPAVTDGWLDRMGSGMDPQEREAWTQVMQRVRQRGHSYGLGLNAHNELWARLIEQPDTGAGDVREVEKIIDTMLAGYEQRNLVPGRTYDVRMIAAPVFGPDGQVAFQLTLYGLPPHNNAETIDRFAQRLKTGASEATEALKEGATLPHIPK